ncbi:MAG: hypothetical protein WAK95_12975 [Desulfobacterales bacterium]
MPFYKTITIHFAIDRRAIPMIVSPRNLRFLTTARLTTGGENGQISRYQERYEKKAQQNPQGKEEGKVGKEERKVNMGDA